MYGIAYSDVDKDQRFLGKVASLALNYQGGVRAFQKMAQNYGTDVDEPTAIKIRDDWRAANKPIVKLWNEVERSAMNAVRYGTEQDTRCGSFKFVKGDLLFKLPSKRILSFPRASLADSAYGEKLVYEGVNNHTHRWGEIDSYGGSLVQSITQAVARDLLAQSVLNIENAGYPVVLTVHDEIVADVPKGFGSLDEFNTLMCELPSWAKGLPADVEGYESERYRK
jgi:DNA polymerase